MKNLRWILLSALVGLAAAWLVQAAKMDGLNVITGKAAFTNTTALKPGQARKITAADLPKPGETPSGNSPGGNRTGTRPDGAIPQGPPGFKVSMFVSEGLTTPRQMRRAPNGDIFLADTNGRGGLKILRGMTADGKPQTVSDFASFPNAFGVNFYPPGPNPQWVYVSNTTTVARFAYKNGDLKATGMAETIIPDLPAGGNHTTRDIVFSQDGKSLLVAVGSASNNNDDARETHRANILEYTPDGKFVGIFGAGIRNPVGLAINPVTGDVWTSINERDTYGDNLVPDYVTHVQRDGFYGWPWFYIGANYDPAHTGKHPELASKVIVPDVLLQPHSASLGMAFYDGKMFPADYTGDAFVAEHGSWNHAKGAGHEVIRIPIEKGKASGVYEDFLTGFNTDTNFWGRPVGIAVAPDGSLLVSDDGSKIVWRVTYSK